MIFALQQGVKSELMARGYPVSVAIGPERFAASAPAGRPGGAPLQRFRIVLDYDREVGDSFPGHTGSGYVMARHVGYVARVYASSSAPGAQEWEHTECVQQIVDALIVALHDWTRGFGTSLGVSRGRLLTSEELQGSEVALVAGYELRFGVGNAVVRLDFDGSGEETAVLHDVHVAAQVTLDGEDIEVV